MSINKQIVVTDKIKKKTTKGVFLKLTLCSDQRRILRGKRKTDCSQELHFQLPRGIQLNDGDILLTNFENVFIEIIAQKESLLEINSKSKLELIKTAYHLGNRHIEVEISTDVLFIKSDNVIEGLLKNFNVDFIKTKRNFFPDKGAFNHE